MTQSMCIAAVVAIIDGYLYANVAKFGELFEAFGAELPLLSQWFLQYRQVAGLLLVLAIAVFTILAYAKKTENNQLGWKMRIFSLALAAISVLLTAVVVIAAYLPIFYLGATV